MKKGRVKYFVILNFVILLVIIAVLLIVLKTNNIKLGILDGTSNSYTSAALDDNQEDLEKEPETFENQGVQETEEETEAETEPETEGQVDVFDTITISAAGDVTLGRDSDYGYELTFDHEFERQGGDYGYFFRNVKHIFEEDDISIVNLETTLTTATKKADKTFAFKADPSYIEILKQGDIEAVSIANNHIRDYLEQGYQDTLATLGEGGVGYFGYEHKYIADVRGIKVGIMGLTPWYVSDEYKEIITKSIDELKREGADVVIAMYHWGIERDNYPSSDQVNIAHYTIDSGADLVLGSHPHVLQGIEEYKGKNIVYSLGNFSFGGNKNPKDKDTMIYVHKFNFKNGELFSEDNEIIPCSISSVSSRNNYQPTVLEGDEKDRVMEKIVTFSEALK